MPLSEAESGEISALYTSGQEIAELATAYEVSETTIRNHLKKQNVELRGVRTAESDEDLGIGELERAAAPAPSLDTILNSPAFAAAVEAAVRLRLAESDAQPAPAKSEAGEFGKMLDTIGRMLEVQQIQIPGYIKPLSADEMDRRAGGLVEMHALLEQARIKNDPPRYILGDKFYAGDILYDEGFEIRTYLPPAEHFRPENDSGRKVYAAMMTWIGGPTPEIGEQIAQAMAASKEAPLITGAPAAAASSPVEIVGGAERHDVAPKRVLGNSQPEVRGVSMPIQPGVTQQPAGPVFVG